MATRAEQRHLKQEQVLRICPSNSQPKTRCLSEAACDSACVELGDDE